MRARGLDISVLLLTAIMVVLFGFACAWALKLGTMPEEPDDLFEWGKKVEVNEFQNPRDRKDPAARRASEDVHAMLADNIADMEENPWNFDINPWNWDMPDWWDFPAGDFPWRPNPYPWDITPTIPSGPISTSRVCDTSGLEIVECGECYEWEINQPAGDIISITTLAGPVVLGAWDNSVIPFCVPEGADDGQEISLGYTQIPVVAGRRGVPLVCERTYWVECDSCECVGAYPVMVTDDEDQLMARETCINLWVDTGTACGPFTWTVTGTGFHFNSQAGPTTETTEEELETLRLCTDNTACGLATITVTDKCGVVGVGYIRCTNGTWIYESTICDRILGGSYNREYTTHDDPVLPYAYSVRVYYIASGTVVCEPLCCLYVIDNAISWGFDSTVMDCVSNLCKKIGLGNAYVRDVRRYTWICPP